MLIVNGNLLTFQGEAGLKKWEDRVNKSIEELYELGGGEVKLLFAHGLENKAEGTFERGKPTRIQCTQSIVVDGMSETWTWTSSPPKLVDKEWKSSDPNYFFPVTGLSFNKKDTTKDKTLLYFLTFICPFCEVIPGLPNTFPKQWSLSARKAKDFYVQLPIREASAEVKLREKQARIMRIIYNECSEIELRKIAAALFIPNTAMMKADDLKLALQQFASMNSRDQDKFIEIHLDVVRLIKSEVPSVSESNADIQRAIDKVLIKFDKRLGQKCWRYLKDGKLTTDEDLIILRVSGAENPLEALSKYMEDHPKAHELLRQRTPME